VNIGLDVSAALAGGSGLAFYVERLLEALAARAPEDKLYLTAVFHSRPERLRALRLPRGSNVEVVFRRFPQRLLLPLEEAGLRLRARWLAGLSLDVFHGLGNAAPPMPVPTVVTLHHAGSLPDSMGVWDRFYFGRLTPRSLRRAAAVIAVSESTRAQALRQWRLDPAKVSVVWEGGPGAEFRPGGGADPKNPYILHVGAFVERKNIGILLEGFARFLKADPARRERLVLIGHEGDALAPARERIRALGIESRVEIRTQSPRPEIVALYQGARMVVVPSLLEGFGFPVLEAMACGVPVLCSNASSLPEIAGGAALLFDPLDAEALARAIKGVADDAALADRLREAGLARVKQFSWERAADETLAVYRGVRRINK